MKKKVLILITKSNLGGAQRYVYDLATKLPKEKFEVIVATGKAQGADGPGALIPMLQRAGIRTCFVGALERNMGLADITAYREIAAVITKERPDVLHLNSSKAGGLGALAGRIAGVPHIVFTSHGLAYDEPRNAFERFLILVATWATFLLCDRVICISQDIYDRARALPFVSRRMTLILNGIGPVSFLAKETAKSTLREFDPRIRPDVPLFGSIAEFVPNKNIELAIRACQILVQREVRFAYLIIGTGDQKAELENLVRELGLENYVFLLGRIDNAATYLHAFDCFVLPSRKEGVPYVLLEAAQAMVPIVGSDIPGIRAVVGNDANNLVSTDDADALATTMKRVIDDPARAAAITESIAKEAGEKFSLERMVAETAAVYQ